MESGDEGRRRANEWRETYIETNFLAFIRVIDISSVMSVMEA
jgi:hypothetical protein